MTSAKTISLTTTTGITLTYPSKQPTPNSTTGEIAPEHKQLTGNKLLTNPSLEPTLASLKGRPVALMIEQTLYDLMTPITSGGTVKILTLADAETLPIYRHTAAHVMAYAIRTLFPDVKFAIGPAIDNGFYYDMDNITLNASDFKAIEKAMQTIIKEQFENKRFEISYKEALALFKDEPYKIELIKDLGETTPLTYYKMGDFIDLCRGPHLPTIAPIKGFKLNKLAGAYWRGKATNKMLTRLYALAFLDKPSLKTYITKVAEQERYDHNKIGREMDLFINDALVGQGLPLLTHKGTLVKQRIQTLVETEERRAGYLHTLTPHLAKSDLYKTSGHWDHYKDSMFIIQSGDDEFALRPMTCPFHFALYNSQRRSYKELPIRYAETSTLFRNEASGEMHGLIRVRQFTLSDGHIICTNDQVEQEFKSCLELLLYFLKILDIKNYTFRLSKWDAAEAGSKFIDNPAMWEQTEDQMRTILTKYNYSFVEAVGEAAFYGPKLDVQTTNVYGKEDTLLTIQIDFALPERFKMTYIDENDKKQQPVVIHRASIGCYERTIALLVERYHGNLPFWLAPDQIAIFPVHNKLTAYAKGLETQFIKEGFQVLCDTREESLGKRIRSVQKSRIPYLLIIGDKEQATETLSVRTRDNKVLDGIAIKDFIAACHEMQRNHLLECQVSTLKKTATS
ncbi:threonine--tRNA ligase [Spirochaetota bacterium]|nr:threonine--tRNA ligase [Spirochaetota bacterium]